MNFLKLALSGENGKIFLLDGKTKTALVDCSMAYRGYDLVENLKEILKDRPLDFLLMSHSHYDHIGSLPILKKAYPNLKALGAPYAARVLSKASALNAIREYSIQAASVFAPNGPFLNGDYDLSALQVDGEIKDGDLLNIGDLQIRVIESIGHTKCSLSFYLENQKLLFASETAGMVIDEDHMSPTFLISYEETINTLKKLEALHAEKIICPHYGLVEGDFAKKYFSVAMKSAEEGKNFILESIKSNLSKEECVAQYMEKFRSRYGISQKLDSIYKMNSSISYDLIVREFLTSEN